MFERSHKQVLADRLEKENRKFIQVIYGPRQVGKTTIVSQFARQTRIPVHYASADAVISPQGTWITQQWEAARFLLSGSHKGEAILIIDEIQSGSVSGGYTSGQIFQLTVSRLIAHERLTPF